ncbi:hypothetical protein F3Y22_tig00111276pilonHSYRG00050 [Hibiscus syriacus]|uniref:Auxin efflux carrier family protein n=1 Tax=Hibiscus syriacus TaxID=106335 RepID=A0A6A2YRR7_HIBSY|nr:hypothetical protein F3Y22_tig00111276pilonHSYRG00050 [Hibiscus syriacus]
MLAEHIVQLIAAVKPPLARLRRDGLGWRWEANKSFTTKSAYHSFTQPEDSWLNWKIIWKVEAPQRSAEVWAMRLIDLLIVALIPVTKVLSVTGVGLFLALDHVYLLGPDARNHLNKLVFYVFGPSLVAINLAGTITFDSFLTLSSAFAWILIKITKLPSTFKAWSSAVVLLLPLILVPAVCEEPNNPFGDSSTCSANAGAYASLSLAVGAIFIWSYAYAIMRSYANSCKQDSLAITIDTFKETTSESFSENCRIDRRDSLAIRQLLNGADAPLRGANSCMHDLASGSKSSKGLKRTRHESFNYSAVRNILMPLFGVGVVRAAQHFGVVGSDPLFQFVLMLQYAFPPAMSVGTMTQLFQVGQSESSVIILWTYAVAAFSITIWLTVFMWLLV